MKVTDNSTYRLMQTNLDRITNRLQDLRFQGATGIKLNKPSDDPASIRPVLTTRTQIRHTERYLETMGVTADKMQSTDGHLEHVENILQRVKEIGINGINSAMSPADLATLADEVEQLKEELLAGANATLDGKYIFAGYQENTKPFVENNNYDPALWDQNNPNTWPYLYQGDSHTTELEITPGERLETNITGNDLFFGIANTTIQSGNPTQPPPTGIQIGGSLTPGPGAGNDITITAGANPPVVISGAADLIDVDDNYAQRVAGLLDGSLAGTPTGLTATVNPSSSNSSGSFTPTTGVADSLTVNGETISSGPSASASSFDSKIDNYIATVSSADPSLAGGSIAQGNGWFTDSNGNVINITGSAQTGDLTFSAANGADITVTESVTNPAEGFTTSTYANSTETTYGTVDIGTNTADDVVLAGVAGLASAGLTPASLDAATGYPPDSGRMDMFSALTRMEEALRAGNINDPNGPGGGISQGIDNLETIADQERRLRSRLGNRSKRVESAMLHQQDVKIDLQQILSRYQDTDVIENFNEIIKQETAFKAALSITAKISDISILDFF